MHKLIKVHPIDNVAVALTDLRANEIISFEGQDIQIVNHVLMLIEN